VQKAFLQCHGHTTHPSCQQEQGNTLAVDQKNTPDSAEKKGHLLLMNKIQPTPPYCQCQTHNDTISMGTGQKKSVCTKACNSSFQWYNGAPAPLVIMHITNYPINSIKEAPLVSVLLLTTTSN
jgi:hypothetical protein